MDAPETLSIYYGDKTAGTGHLLDMHYGKATLKYVPWHRGYSLPGLVKMDAKTPSLGGVAFPGELGYCCRVVPADTAKRLVVKLHESMVANPHVNVSSFARASRG